MTNIPVNAALVKIVGVFSYSPQKDFPKFTADGYYTMNIVDLPKAFKNGKGSVEIEQAIKDTKAFYKNTYYSEFRDLMFTGKDTKNNESLQTKSFRMFQRDKDLNGVLFTTNEMPGLPFVSKRQEIFLFPDGIGIFSFHLDVIGKSLAEISDLTNKVRFFNSKLCNRPEKQDELHHWISEHVLCGIKIVGDKLEVDEYSGSKFKVYSVFDLPASTPDLPYDRDALLYELGTSSRIGTIASVGFYKPSDDYYHLILQNKISAFANYDCLALLDSFTVVGTGNYLALSDEDDKYITHHIWNRSYFALYIFNLYVRYNIYKFNSLFLSNPVKYRNIFQNFLNNYNFTHISFNFLPNMIFSKMRSALGIDTEIETFEKRLTAIAASVQEAQEKRQALLLTLISVVSSFSAAKDILQSLNSAQQWLGWSCTLFYSALAFIALLSVSGLFYFFFPLTAKRLIRKWNKFREKTKKKR